MSIVRSDAIGGISLEMIDTSVQLQPPLTMAVWARLDVNPADATIRGVVDFTTTSYAAGLIGYNLMLVSSKFNAYVRYAPKTWGTVAALANASVGKWYHLALRVFDVEVGYAGSRTLEFFIDGVSQGTNVQSYSTDPLDPIPAPDIRWVASKLMLGRYISNLCEAALQGLAIWNAKLSDAEISYLAGSRAHWAPMMVGQAATIRPHWPFDEMNDEEQPGVNPKNFSNRGKYISATDNFAPGGTNSGSTGHKTRGQSIPTIYGPGARMITVSAPAAAAPSFRGLALCGVGK